MRKIGQLPQHQSRRLHRVGAGQGAHAGCRPRLPRHRSRGIRHGTQASRPPGRYGSRVSSDRYETEMVQHVRRLRRRAWRDRARESLLFLPSMMLLGAIVLALILGEVDTTAAAELPAVFTFAPSTASTLLSTIAGATITTAGVVFSLLVVSLQLASAQFSPRVLRGFRRDRLAQGFVGVLLSTFAFCVIALAQLDPEADQA